MVSASMQSVAKSSLKPVTNKGALRKRSMRLAGHRTSLALEDEFWAALESIARARATSLPVLIASIDEARAKSAPEASLASAVRVYVLAHKD
jgi:predicted DNA-binding ribbon-helix-helix protein